MKTRLLISLLLVGTLLLFASCSGMRAPQETKMTKENNEQRTEETMQFACDVVFFGDSITAQGNFDELFPELRVVNLGVYGDTLEDLLRRVPKVRAADPAKIFLLGGINSLGPLSVEECLRQYDELLAALRAACPAAELYVESVLPVGAEFDLYPGGANDLVRAFNESLKALAERYGLTWVELYALYEKDGALDPALTVDGVHLTAAAYGPWAELITPYLK